MLEEVPNVENLEETKMQQAGNLAEPILSANKLEKKYFKIIFSKEKEGVTQFLQAEYENSTMKNSSLLKTRYFPDLKAILENNVQVERNLFYSIVSMYALNDSRFISNFLSKHGEGYQSNQLVLNEEKFKLLDEYRSYLSAIKGDEALKETRESPLNPEDEEKGKLVKEVLKTAMYKPSDRIKLERKGGDFFWRVDLQSVQAYFTNEKHQLKTLEVTTPSGNLSMNLSDYILFDGIHELPKDIYFRDLADRHFRIRFLSFSNWINKGKTLEVRAKDYLKLETKLRKVRDENKPVVAPENVETISELPIPVNFVF